MGLFDTFIVFNYRCPKCGHMNAEVDFQTKDFDNHLDHIKVGEDVRDDVEVWFLNNATIFGESKLSKKQAESLTRRYPHKYKMSSFENDDDNWSIYKYAGKRKRNFSHIRYATFELHGGCDGCDVFIETVGHIEDYIFKGIKQ